MDALLSRDLIYMEWCLSYTKQPIWPRERAMPQKEESLWDDVVSEADAAAAAGIDFCLEDMAESTLKVRRQTFLYYSCKKR